MAHLGHRVMSPALRAEPVRTREEIRLEDRLQHQLQRCLDHPIPDRGDPQATQLAARLGIIRSRTGNGRKLRSFNSDRSPSRNILDARPPRWTTRSRHPPRPCGTLVAPHPIPGHQQERRIGDEVEQIIEPAMRIITGPTVQLV